jgi:Alkylated DNA repair protein
MWLPSHQIGAILPVIISETKQAEQKMPLERQLLPDAELDWQADFLSPDEADRWYQCLLQRVAWQQLPIRMFGQVHLQPRLICWYGEASYTYSHLTLPVTAWPDWFLPLKQKVEQAVGARFNGVLLNYYRNGQDSMGWHSDDEPELGENPLIASLSLGATRRFSLKHKHEPLKQTVQLTNGSLLVMGGRMQHHWLHALPKMARVHDGRINLTFRQILTDS